MSEQASTENTRVRLGIIGCGIAAHELHWPALLALENLFRITAVCNHTEEKARIFAQVVGEHYGEEIPYVLDYRDLLSMSEVDAVSVILPIGMNEDVCQAIADAGKHMLVEKPLAADLEGADKLERLEREHPHIVMMVAENLRYRPVYAALTDAINTGRLGTPYFVESKSWQQIDFTTNQYAHTRWRIEHSYEGGFVMDGGIHHVAALRDLIGDIEIIGSATQSVDPKVGRTDTLTALFRTTGTPVSSRLFGILSIGYSVSGLRGNRLTVLGSAGTAVVEGTRLTLHGQDAGNAPSFHDYPDDDAPSFHDYPDDGGYEAEYRDFHRAITTGQPPKSTFEKAAGDLRTMLAALHPAEH